MLMIQRRGIASSVGFIGLGQMGYRMANRLAPQYPHLVVYDVIKESCNTLQKEHSSIRIASSPRQVAEQCDAIVTMLPATEHVLDVYLNEKSGVIGAASKGKIYIDASTIDVQATQKWQAALRHCGAITADAPVSGGVTGAAAGTLTFMIGTELESDISNAIQPILSSMGKSFIYCGGPGMGLVAKQCNNLLLAISMIGTCEALKLGERLGIDLKILSEILSKSTGRCWSVDSYNPCPGIMPNVPSSRQYAGGFAVDLMTKDLKLAVKGAESKSLELPLGQEALRFYQQLQAKGLGRKDFSVVFENL